jgi:hypothetical protein
MNLNEMFPSSYLSKNDFSAPRVLVMAKVTKEEVWRKNGKQITAVLHFQGSKPMILNKTNALMIARIYGPDTVAWVGNPITVYHDPNVMLGRDRVGGIRLCAESRQKVIEPNGETNKAASDGRARKKSLVRKASPGEVEILAQWIRYEKCDLAKILAHYGIAAISDIPDAVFDDCMVKVKGKFAGFMPTRPSSPLPARAKFPSEPPATAKSSRFAGART